MKKTQSIILYLLLFICIGFNMLLYIKLKDLKKEKYIIETNFSNAQNWNTKLDLIYQNKRIEQLSEDLPFPNLMIWDQKGDYIYLADYLSASKKLVFYFNEYNCDLCTQNALQKLKKFSKEIGEHNIMAIANYADARHFRAFCNSEKLPFPIFNANGQSLNLPIVNVDMPFFCLLDKGMTSQQIFIPIKEIEEYTSNYLSTMNKKYWLSSRE